MTMHIQTRRRFLMQAAFAAVALPLAARLIANAEARALVKLPVDNPQARALGYVEDARTTRNAAYKPRSECSNCQFFSATTGACSLFAGFQVSATGWCTAWSKKAG